MAFPSTPLGLQVQLALGADLTADPSTWTWTNITGYVHYPAGIQITRGSRDGSGEVQPTEVKLTLDNRDGRFTPRNPLGAYYGQIGRNTPLRVRIDPGSGYTTRATVYVDEWPTRWAGGERWIYAPIVGSGILRRLGQGGQLKSALYRANSKPKYLDGSVVAYWPCEDPSGSTIIASGIGGQRGYIGNTQPEFAADSDIDGSAALMKNGDTTTALIFNVEPYESLTPNQWSVSWTMRIPSEPGAQIPIMNIQTPSHYFVLRLSPGSPSLLNLYCYNSSGTEIFADAGADFGAATTEPYDDQVHFRIYAQQDGTSVDWGYEFAASDGTASGKVGTEPSMTLTSIYRAFTHQVPADVTIGHIAVSNDVDFHLFDMIDLARGYLAETTTTRFFRLCSEEGVPVDFDPGPGDAAPMGVQDIDTITGHLQLCAVTEQGPMRESRTGYLVLRERSAQQNRSVELALDHNSGHLRELEPADDDQRLVNDANVSRSGSSAGAGRAVADPPNDPGTIGTYGESLTANPEADEYLRQLASWRVHVGTVDDLRYPTVGLQLHRNPSLITQWLACDIGSRVTVDNPPPTLPPDPIDVIIEGYTETLSTRAWDVVMNTSPARVWEVMVLEDNRLGRLQTTGSTVQAALTNTGTSAIIASQDGTKWSTTAEPYDWNLAGERVTATALTDQAPQFIGAGAVAHANNASVVPTMPTFAAGDLLLCFAAIRNSGTGVPNTPAGWERLDVFDDTDNAQLFARLAVSGDTSPTVSFTGGVANADTSAQIASWRYAQLNLIAAAAQLNSSAQNIATPAFGIPRTGTVIVYLGWRADDWTSVTSPGDAEIGEPDTTTGDDQGLVWSYDIQTSVGFGAANTFTVTGGASAISRGAVAVFAGDTQTATITRSVNGVVKAQTAGTSVKLWRPGVLAL